MSLRMKYRKARSLLPLALYPARSETETRDCFSPSRGVNASRFSTEARLRRVYANPFTREETANSVYPYPTPAPIGRIGIVRLSKCARFTSGLFLFVFPLFAEQLSTEPRDRCT